MSLSKDKNQPSYLIITGGLFRGRKIQTVHDARTRYTPEIVRGALFSTLRARIELEGSRFLDLCAGSGIVAFEALSRGMKQATLVDISHKAIRAGVINSRRLGVLDRIKIRRMDLGKYLQKTTESYDVVFLDPPFDESIVHKYLIAVDASMNHNPSFLSKSGIFVLECREGIMLPSLRSLRMIHKAAYGSVCLTYYQPFNDQSNKKGGEQPMGLQTNDEKNRGD